MRRVIVCLALSVIMAVIWCDLSPAQEQPSYDGELPVYRTAPIEVDRDEITDPVLVQEPIWQSLADMPFERRANAEIMVCLEDDAETAALQKAEEIAGLWNEGSFDEALAMFPELAKLSDPRDISLGIDWRIPLATAAEDRWGGDVRIGTRDSVYITDLEIDHVTRNLFAVLLCRQGTNYYWSMNFSSDNGQTWTETYAWGETNFLYDICATIVANHCYVFFTRGADFNEVRGFRFRLNDGGRENFPSTAFYVTAFTTSDPVEIRELDATSSVDYGFGTYRLYLVAITNYDDLLFYWDDETAESFSAIPTGVSNAERGLDICMNVGYSDYWLFASYYDNTDYLCIDGFGDAYSWDNTARRVLNGSYPRISSIGAWQDTVFCFYEYHGQQVIYCKYQISYNGGTGYVWGVVDDTTNYMSECPAVCARNGGGIAAIYRYYSTPREGRYVWRDYPWPWLVGPQHYTDHAPFYNQPAIQHMGGEVCGIVYTCWNDPYIQAAYFDTGPGCCNLPGDANNDGGVNVGDAVFMINYVFKGGDPPECVPEGDANNDCALNVGDAVHLINYVFKSGTPPECGCYIR